MEEKAKINSFINFLKEKGFIYSGSEIYGGLSNTWDYGPLGSLLKKNLKDLWINSFIFQQKNNFLLDSSIMLNNKVWEASGHVEKFNDPLIDCKKCKSRFRADHLVEENTQVKTGNLSIKEMETIIKDKISCPKCQSNNWTDVREFKLMFETSNSKTKSDLIYLRPETAQGVFINFNNYKNGKFGKLPFGIGQIGKAFRNEITPGNFIFRTKEFEQMELEYYFHDLGNGNDYFEEYVSIVEKFLKKVGIADKNFRLFEVPKDELAHYSKRTIDFEYNFPFGWGELLGIANRGNFDLTNHSQHSQEKLNYRLEDGEVIIPSVIETSIGVERLLFSILWEAWTNKTENYFPIPQEIVPYKMVFLPLTKNEIELTNKIIEEIITPSKVFSNILVFEKGNIGKRYKHADEFGIPFSITIDQETKSLDGEVTIRFAKTKEQIKIKIKELEDFFFKN